VANWLLQQKQHQQELLQQFERQAVAQQLTS
jgi:hypothetical protein